MTIQASSIFGATVCTETGVLSATAGANSTYVTANAVNGSILGKFVTELAAQTDTATETTDFAGNAFTAINASEGGVFVWSLNAAGAVKIHQGPVEKLFTEDGSFRIAPVFPGVDREVYMPFGYVIVQIDSTGSAWTFGASNWNATGITATFVNVSTLPLRPQTP